MTLENFNSKPTPEQGPQKIEVIHIDTLGDLPRESNVISAIFADNKVYFASLNSKNPDEQHSHIEHMRLQYVAKIPEKDIVGGLVVRHQDHTLRISRTSGSFENQPPPNEIEHYVKALMEKLKTIYPESDIASSKDSPFI